MNETKYITDQYDAVIFSDGADHSKMASGLSTPVGAGFVTLSQNPETGRFTATPYGKSTTLGIGVHPGDKQKLEWMLNGLFG